MANTNTKEVHLQTFDVNYNQASVKADPYQRLVINFMAATLKQNEEILEELKKLNSK